MNKLKHFINFLLQRLESPRGPPPQAQRTSPTPPREPPQPERTTPPKEETQHPQLGAKEIADLEKELELDLENLDVNDTAVSIITSPFCFLNIYTRSVTIASIGRA